MSVKATSRIPQIIARAEIGAQKAVMETAFEIERGAKMRAAVDTGYMRSRITTQREDDYEAAVIAYALYSIFVEFGTRYMAAQPFMRPAAEAQRQRFAQAVASLYR